MFKQKHMMTGITNIRNQSKNLGYLQGFGYQNIKQVVDALTVATKNTFLHYNLTMKDKKLYLYLKQGQVLLV